MKEAPQDIGPLLKEIQEDVTKECTEEIKNALFNAYKKDILRGVIAGFAEWYKSRLMEDAGIAS